MGEASCILWAAAGLDPAAGGMAASHHPSCTGHQQLSWITIGTVYSLSSHPNIILYGITWCMKVKERWVSKVCKELPYPACLVRKRKNLEKCVWFTENLVCVGIEELGEDFFTLYDHFLTWRWGSFACAVLCLWSSTYIMVQMWMEVKVGVSESEILYSSSCHVYSHLAYTGTGYWKGKD